MHRQWNNEMMRLANGEVDSSSGIASCQSIKNSSEELDIYYISVCKLNYSHMQICMYLYLQYGMCWTLQFDNLLTRCYSWSVWTFCFQKMRELILTSSLKVRMEAENDKLTKTLGQWFCYPWHVNSRLWLPHFCPKLTV